MTDEKKLLQLIETRQQCNIDLCVYQWLVQGFPKYLLKRHLATLLMTGKDFYDNGLNVENYRLHYQYDACGSFIILSCDKVILDKKRIFNQMDFHSFYQDFFAKILDLIESKLTKTE